MSTNEFIEIFSGHIQEVELVKSFLESAKIEVFLKDEITGSLFPWYTSAGGVGAVKLLVHEADLNEAEDIISDFYNSRS